MKNKGITLIALVITIIVLLILAGISIATLTGDEGILTKTTDARKAQDNGTEKDEIGLAYNAAKLDSKGKAIEAEKLQEELRKYDSGATVVVEGENFKVTFTNGNTYTVKKDGTIEGPTNTQENSQVEGKLAKEVLKTNESGTEDYEKSPYVEYNGITCRVLYNDETHGLQIISADNVENVKLGYEDDMVEAADFDWNNEDDIFTFEEGSTLEQFKHAAASYNELVDTLNKKAKEHMLGTDKVVTDARCFGSNPILEEGKFQADTTTTDYSNEYEYFSTLNNKFKPNYDYTNDDVNTIKVLNLRATDDSWRARRIVLSASSVTAFAADQLTPNDGNAGSTVCLIYRSR